MTSTEKISEIRAIRVTTGWDCNLDCRYCSQRHSACSLKAKDNVDGKQILSLYGLFKNFGDKIIRNGTLDIELEGGEPLLHPDVILAAVKLADQMKTDTRNVRYMIFTNARLLNKEPARELVRKISLGRDLVIAPSFDHQWKHPAKITDDTYRFMKEHSRVNPTYVIEGKHVLKEAEKNIRYLNDRGFKVSVSWNFFAYDELEGETRKDLIRLMREVNVFRNQGWTGNIPWCGWIGISPKGRFYPCYESVLGNIDIEEGRKFEETHCTACPLKGWCRQCIVRKAFFKEKLCNYVKIMHELETEVT